MRKQWCLTNAGGVAQYAAQISEGTGNGSTNEMHAGRMQPSNSLI